MLLFILIGDLSLHFILLKIKKNEIKRTIKEVILEKTPEKQLEILEFSFDELKNLNWKEKREFELNGEMYDVLKSDTLNSKIKLITFKDKEETKLIANFKSFLNDKLSDKINKIVNSKSFNFDGFTQNIFVNNQFPDIIFKEFIYNSQEHSSNFFCKINQPPEFLA